MKRTYAYKCAIVLNVLNKVYTIKAASEIACVSVATVKKWIAEIGN